MTTANTTVCLDFDGVIHSFTSPWTGDDIISDEPVTGCRETLLFLKQSGTRIVVHSVRCRTPRGRAAIADYMRTHAIPFDEVSEHKPIADFYVDDRAIRFTGNWNYITNRVVAK